MRTENIATAETARRRALLLGACAWLLPVGGAGAQASVAMAEVPLLAFAGFELIDEQPDPARTALQPPRLARISEQMARGLHERGLYRVVEAANVSVSAAVARVRETQELLHRCNGCLDPIAQAAQARLVGVGWVQRVSNLILNLNLAVWDVPDDRMTLTKSVDIRGDNDESWRRGVDYMLRDMVERRVRQPRYGL